MSLSLYARLRHRYGPRPTDVSRRALMKTSLAAGAGLLLSSGCSAPSRRVTPAGHGKRVAIVGAGFAGLACAHELRAAGYDVRLFEARTRLGGRVLSFRDLVPGKTVEGGGELIGRNHPTWLAYADRFGLSFLDVTDDESLDYPVMLNGKHLDHAAAKALYEDMDKAFLRMVADARAVDADRPWLTPAAAALDRRPTSAWVESLACSPLCRHAVATLMTANNGVPADGQSYLGNLAQVKGGGLEDYFTESESLRCRGGNQQLALKLAEAVGHRRISLGTPVRAIDVRDDRVVLTTDGDDVTEADDVVLAIPPALWRRIRINPELPPGLAPQLGASVKYLLATREPFWQGLNLSPWALTDGDVHLTWDATDGQPGPGACLTAFSSAASAERCRAAVLPFDRNARYLYELCKLYPGLRDQVTATRFMDWPGTPWTQAGYACPAPGQVTAQGPILHAGLGRLHFAGEHTCYAFVGYMEGALRSGVTLARRLAQRDALVKAL